MKRILLFTVIFSTFNCIVRSQAQKDPLLYTAKLLLASEKFAMDSIDWVFFLSKYQCNYIESKGFDNIKFISIESRGDSTLKNEKGKPYLDNQYYFSCHYIVAYNPQTFLFYKLKGFRTIEIFDFINDLKRYSKYQEGSEFFHANDEKAIKMIEHNACFVEQLDIDCLRKYFQSDSMYKNQALFPCILSCVKRDNSL